MKLRYDRHLKRIGDIVFVVLFFVCFVWLWLLIVLLYVACWEFPVFFKQLRTGRGEKPFLLYKFRTLSTDTSKPLPERQFPLGKVLRATGLDELPQMWNILRGEMSLIGPRPLPVEYLELFSPEQRRRHEVLPGITGWAQVNGRHGIPWGEKLKLDLYYVNHLSLALDLRIAGKTIRGLFQPGKDVSLLEKPFAGEQ